MNRIKTFCANVLSRKLLVAAGTAAALGYEKQWYACAAVVVAYVAGEAHVDAKAVNRVAGDVAKDAPMVAAVAEAADPTVAPMVKTAETVVEDAAKAVETSAEAAAVEAAPSTPVTPAEAAGVVTEAAAAVTPAATPSNVASSLEDDIRALVEKAKQVV